MKNLTQEELAAAAGLPRLLVCRYEKGLRSPGPEEVGSLALALGKDFAATDAAVHFDPMAARVPLPPPPRPDRTLPSRWGAAKALNFRLLQRHARAIERRPDAHAVKTWLRDVWTDSGDEVFLWMAAAVECESPRVSTLLQLGFRRFPAVCPQREISIGDLPLTGLLISRPFEAMLFPQVTLLVRNQKHRLDCLARLGRERWAVIEVDGDGHCSAWDEARDLNLEMPVIRLSRGDVLHPNLMGNLAERLAASW